MKKNNIDDCNFANLFIVNFFATPLPDYCKEIENLSLIDNSEKNINQNDNE